MYLSRGLIPQIRHHQPPYNIIQCQPTPSSEDFCVKYARSKNLHGQHSFDRNVRYQSHAPDEITMTMMVVSKL